MNPSLKKIPIDEQADSCIVAADAPMHPLPKMMTHITGSFGPKLNILTHDNQANPQSLANICREIHLIHAPSPSICSFKAKDSIDAALPNRENWASISVCMNKRHLLKKDSLRREISNEKKNKGTSLSTKGQTLEPMFSISKVQSKTKDAIMAIYSPESMDQKESLDIQTQGENRGKKNGLKLVSLSLQDDVEQLAHEKLNKMKSYPIKAISTSPTSLSGRVIFTQNRITIGKGNLRNSSGCQD
jgi:hypothetical protein